MTPLEARAAVLERWAEQWVDDSDDELTVTIFDNEGVAALAEDVTAYAFVQVREVDSIQATFGAPGGRIFHRTDLVLIQIGTPANAGRGDTDEGDLGADTLAHRARSIFEASSFAGVAGRAGRVQPGDVAGRWAITTIQIPIAYSETK